MINLFAIYLVCSGIYIFFGSNVLLKNSRNTVNRLFFAICINLSAWSYMLSMMVIAEKIEQATFLRKISVFSWGTLYCLTLYFIIFLTKNDKHLKNIWIHMVLLAPAVFVTSLYYFMPATTEDIVKVSTGWAFINTVDRGIIWDYSFNLYYFSYITMSVFLLWNWRKKAEFKREKMQAKIIISTLFVTLIGGSLVDVIIPKVGIFIVPPLTPVLIAIVIFGIWISMSKYELMSITDDKVVLDVLKVMKEGLFVLNYEGIITSVNKGALDMLGYSDDDLIGKPAKILIPENMYDIKLGEYFKSEFDLPNKNGESIPVLMSISVLRDDCGDRLGHLIIFQDISEIKRMQSELKKANNNLEKRVIDRTKELGDINIVLRKEVKKRMEKEKKINELIYTDVLTNLPNRRYFDLEINKAIIQAERSEMAFAVLFLDLDGFKIINDSLGHDKGDLLLKKIALILSSSLRKSDIVARAGGDEFFILIQNLKNIESVKKVCKNILTNISKPIMLLGNEIHITTSIGVSIFPNDGADAEILVRNADIAMYKAKEQGKGNHRLFDEKMRTNIDEVMKMTNDLYSALRNDEFELYYQPQVRVKDNSIVGFEALIRWNHPQMGQISPVKFIPIAERTGEIVDIGNWVLRCACMKIKEWQKYKAKDIKIAVNLSVNQLKCKGFVKCVSEIINEIGINPKNLELEITENILMVDTDYIIGVLDELKKLKVKIAIDDFGTEYSSLSYLKKMPLDRIKIAKTFVDGIGKNIKDESIITTVIILSKKLGIQTIAEGVEKAMQNEFLKDQQCDEIQGFYYYKPMTGKEAEDLLFVKTEIKENMYRQIVL